MTRPLLHVLKCTRGLHTINIYNYNIHNCNVIDNISYILFEVVGWNGFKSYFFLTSKHERTNNVHYLEYLMCFGWWLGWKSLCLWKWFDNFFVCRIWLVVIASPCWYILRYLSAHICLWCVHLYWIVWLFVGNNGEDG